MKQFALFTRIYLEERLPKRRFRQVLGRFMKLHRSNLVDVTDFFAHRLWRDNLDTQHWSKFIGRRKLSFALDCLNPTSHRAMVEDSEVFAELCSAANLPIWQGGDCPSESHDHSNAGSPPPAALEVFTLLDEDGTSHILAVFALCHDQTTADSPQEVSMLKLAADGADGRQEPGSASAGDGAHPSQMGQILHLDEASRLAQRAASEFYPLRALAWHVVVTERGPFLASADCRWDLDVQRVTDRGLWSTRFAEVASKAIQLGPQPPPWWT